MRAALLWLLLILDARHAEGTACSWVLKPCGQCTAIPVRCMNPVPAPEVQGNRRLEEGCVAAASLWPEMLVCKDGEDGEKQKCTGTGIEADSEKRMVEINVFVSNDCLNQKGEPMKAFIKNKSGINISLSNCKEQGSKNRDGSRGCEVRESVPMLDPKWTPADDFNYYPMENRTNEGWVKILLKNGALAKNADPRHVLIGTLHVKLSASILDKHTKTLNVDAKFDDRSIEVDAVGCSHLDSDAKGQAAVAVVTLTTTTTSTRPCSCFEMCCELSPTGFYFPVDPKVCEVAVETAANGVDASMKARLEAAGAQAGNLRVSLAWDTTDDLDLHVETPAGNISYNNKRVGGGTLDVDQGPQHDRRDPVENVFWDQIPEGDYKVKVKMYSRGGEHSLSTIPFRVTLVSQTGSVSVGPPDAGVMTEVSSKTWTGSFETGGIWQNMFRFKIAHRSSPVVDGQRLQQKWTVDNGEGVSGAGTPLAAGSLLALFGVLLLSVSAAVVRRPGMAESLLRGTEELESMQSERTSFLD